MRAIVLLMAALLWTGLASAKEPSRDGTKKPPAAPGTGAGGDAAPPENGAPPAAESGGSELADAIGGNYRVVPTAHFRFESDMDPADLQEIAQTSERLCDRFCALFKVSPDRLFPERARVYILQKKDAWETYVSAITGGGEDPWAMELKKSGGSRHEEGTPTIACCVEIQNTDNVKHWVYHGVGHFLVELHRKRSVIPAWVEEGFASWAESEAMEYPGSGCVAPGESFNKPEMQGWRHGNQWRTQLWYAVKNRTDPPMKDFVNRDVNGMMPDQHAKAWSLICFILEKKPENFIAWVEALKEKENDKIFLDAKQQEERFNKIYKLKFDALEKDWRAWVRKKYGE
jgi:hypothetical protein